MPPDRYEPGQIVTVFRNRVLPEAGETYGDDAARVLELARTMPGFVDIKDFTAGDGERVTVITFADEESQERWRRHVDHLAAQQRGRRRYYIEYTLQVCRTLRVSSFAAPAASGGDKVEG